MRFKNHETVLYENKMCYMYMYVGIYDTKCWQREFGNHTQRIFPAMLNDYEIQQLSNIKHD